MTDIHDLPAAYAELTQRQPATEEAVALFSSTALTSAACQAVYAICQLHTTSNDPAECRDQLAIRLGQVINELTTQLSCWARPIGYVEPSAPLH